MSNKGDGIRLDPQTAWEQMMVEENTVYLEMYFTRDAQNQLNKGAGSGLEMLVLKNKLSQKVIFQDLTVCSNS